MKCLLPALLVLGFPALLLAAPAPAPATPPAEPPAASGPSLESELGALRLENARLKEQLDRLGQDARNAPAIERENQQLRQEILTLQSERGRLQHENQTLDSWRSGLRTGAVIFALGVVIGALLGRVRRRAGWSDI